MMTDTLRFTLEDLLREMVKEGASDIHVKSGSPPGFRIDGEIVTKSKYGRLGPEHTRQLAYQILTKEQIASFEEFGDLDCSFAVPGLSRFRVNILIQRDTVGIVIRQIPDRIPTVKELRLPKVCLDLVEKPRGLVLVTGPTGSGKSTSLAAMINHINETTRGHILTMEDPLEFMHEDKGCFVTQRQIGSDCKTFQQALRRALRQDPDVILIGEMRDLETIELAITAAETGHLVLGTLHTTSAISTVDRMIDVFPTDAQQQVRIQLASTLQGVISQTLCPKIGGGRVPAHEILIATDGVRSLIREGKTPQILNFLQTGSKHGMVTLEQSLLRLVEEKLVYSSEARGKANRPEEIPDTNPEPESHKRSRVRPPQLTSGRHVASPAAGGARPAATASSTGRPPATAPATSRPAVAPPAANQPASRPPTGGTPVSAPQARTGGPADDDDDDDPLASLREMAEEEFSKPGTQGGGEQGGEDTGGPQSPLDDGADDDPFEPRRSTIMDMSTPRKPRPRRREI